MKRAALILGLLAITVFGREIGISSVGVIAAEDESEYIEIGGLGDLDLDGYEDFMVFKHSYDMRFELVWGAAEPVFSGTVFDTIHYFVAGTPGNAANGMAPFGDVNGDGWPDVILVFDMYMSDGYHPVGLLTAPHREISVEILDTIYGGMTSVQYLGDFNTDGIEDFLLFTTPVWPTHDSEFLRIYTGGIFETYSYPIWWSIPLDRNPVPIVADFTGDEIMDILYINCYGDSAGIMNGFMEGGEIDSFAPINRSLGDISLSSSTGLGDIDGDGKDEFFDRYSSRIYTLTEADTFAVVHTFPIDELVLRPSPLMDDSIYFLHCEDSSLYKLMPDLSLELRFNSALFAWSIDPLGDINGDDYLEFAAPMIHSYPDDIDSIGIYSFNPDLHAIDEKHVSPVTQVVPIERGTGFIHSELEIRLYDIRGRELARGRTIDTTHLHNGLYIANNGAGSIKVSVVR